MSAPLLDIRGLSVAYGRRHPHRVLAGVDLAVGRGEILGIIGETGSGKTTLARAVVGLAPVEAGRVIFDGHDLTGLRGRQLRDLRRSGAVQFMFQDPLRALDPQWTVAASVGEGLATAGGLDRASIAERVTEALHRVGLDPSLAHRIPAQISGGQRQRVLLARALVTRPRLLICDEPVSALDASNRNHVLRLLDDLRTGSGMTIVVISHDLSSLAGVADRVAVLYRGRLVEEGPIRDVLTEPLHPYAALLTASAPSVRRERRIAPARLRRDPDAAPWAARGGCVFAPQCRFATDTCVDEPLLIDAEYPGRDGARSDLAADRRRVACHHAADWPARLMTAAR